MIPEAHMREIDFHRGVLIDASLFVNQDAAIQDEGEAEYFLVGDGYVVAIYITADGRVAVNEAKLGEFSTGYDA